jgi:NADH-quinone oxidoreductase subunit G
MPTFLLDGKEIEFTPGETILRAALRHNTEIPHYCFHPGLAVTAQCRMCLVDIVDMGNGKGMPKLQTSCSTPASAGMKIESESPKVKEGQNVINEFLLVNHPLDCPICDQAGECDLQDFAFKYGTGHSEMDYEKRTYGWRNVGTFIALERNRCVHCSRCERFSKDIEGSHDFGMFLRSHELTFDTFEDHTITHRFQGNLADICPVGAITNRDWRFKKRAWKFKKVPSVCTSCSTGCNVTVEHHENKVYRIKPRENEAVNRWWMCDEGRINFRDLNDQMTRVVEPQARVQGTLRPATWDAVYQALSARLKEIGASGAQAVALADTHATNEELFLLSTLLKVGFGGGATYFPLVQDKQEEQPPAHLKDTFVFSLIMTDKSPNTAGAKALGLAGDPDGSKALAALKGAKVVFVLGNPFVGNAALQNAAKASQLIVQIGTHEDPWFNVADVILPGHTHAERTGTFTNKVGRVQRMLPALRPPDATREQVRILQELFAAAGKAQEMGSAEKVLGAIASQVPAFKGMTWESVGELGTVLAGK